MKTKKRGLIPRSKRSKSFEPFSIVALGASAGGLETFTELLSSLPPDLGMAYVVIQHLSPERASLLPAILSRVARVPVHEIRDGTQIHPNNIYVIPPGCMIEIDSGTLRTKPRLKGIPNMPIDHFFRSLADDQKNLAIGVVLSGADSDGALGLKEIKSRGGITFVQDPATAKLEGMPNSAIHSGAADYILPVSKIAEELIHLAQIARDTVPGVVAEEDEVLGNSEEFLELFQVLKTSFGVDFSQYKPPTLARRIRRRILLKKLSGFKAYLDLVHASSEERSALYQDLLINVTSFFRDPEVFDSLKTKILPAIIKSKAEGAPIRIWVPGCSTGEEAYSLAICLFETLEEMGQSHPVQIFGTDLSEAMIERARSGLYLEGIKADISPERFRRFFTKVDGGFRVNRTIRDHCVFARHDITRDPPFSRTDLISCRNLLIYLGASLQRKIMTVFGYALNPGGYLLLGSSETTGMSADLFMTADKTHKIYRSKGKVHGVQVDYQKAPAYPVVSRDLRSTLPLGTEKTSLDVLVNRIILSRFSPPAVVVTEDMQILQFRGAIGPFLEPTPGEASLNLFRMARGPLAMELRSLFRDVIKAHSPATRNGLRVQDGQQVREIDLEIIPIEGDWEPRRYLVMFLNSAAQVSASVKRERNLRSGKASKGETAAMNQLRTELEATRAHLHSIIRELESTNEELQAANEEILSSNEELQSTNEELETAKEELQSTNEELTTVNEELGGRYQQLADANNDLKNLLANTSLPIVMVDLDMRIRRFTPASEKTLNVIPSDFGRPISNIKPNFDGPDLEREIRKTIETMGTYESEVQDREGHWYLLRIRPYRTTENKIEGAVITLLDIDSLKRGRSS